MKFVAAVLAIGAALLLAGCAPGGGLQFSLRDPERDADGNLIVWKEGDSKLPAYPVPANAVQFEGGNRDESRFYVDKSTLSVGEDGVVRYTLMVLGDGGGRNVSYEGIRCESREYRVYAYGRDNHSWAIPTVSEWRRVYQQYTNNYRAALMVEYLCKGQSLLPTVREIVASLEQDASRVNRRAPYHD